MSGKSYLQNDKKTKKKVAFAEDELKHLEYCHNLVCQVKPEKEKTIEYASCQAMLIARFIQDIMMNVNQHGASFAQQYMLQKGLKVFGEKGHDALKKEIDQLHKRTCFAPLKVKEMKPSERKKAQMELMFLTEKRDKTVKGRMVYNGKPTREWLSREDAASPTVALESIMITGVIEAKEVRDVMTCDIPNAFIQALLPKKDPAGEDRVVMKITGVLVDMLVDINTELYGPAVVLENRKKVLYIEVLKAIYGMLEAALLWYKTFRKDLEDIGFVFNPYNPSVANRKVQGSQQTILFHVDDLKSSHKTKSVNDRFEKWLNSMYGNHGKVTATCGQVHDYLGMELDYRKRGELKINMTKYVDNMINDFPVELGKKGVTKTPAADSLFNLGTGAKLDMKRSEIFHTSVAKGLFLYKRARPNIQQAISVLCTRVKDPNQADWEKLMRVMKYLNGTRSEYLTLSADDLRVVKWYVDASFAVHPDFKSHTGAVMMLGKGAMQSITRKQKMNLRSSTEGELVAGGR
jgi:Reverse transcriptase (RNA-dependent DNA polymerase)